jgi:putative intracellular protease/amidase
MKILMVLTSHDELGDTGEKTGVWLEEFVAPYYAFLDAGAKVTLASPKGGRPPIDPKSDLKEADDAVLVRFRGDAEAEHALDQTVKLDAVPADYFDAVFYPGGHGPMWDLAEDKHSIQLIEDFMKADKPVGAVCHGPAAFRHVMVKGKPMLKGKRVTGFSNAEEDSVKLTKVVPFLLEDEMKRLGAHYEKGEPGQSFVVTDRHLVTGQNPGSSLATAEALLAQMATV